MLRRYPVANTRSSDSGIFDMVAKKRSNKLRCIVCSIPTARQCLCVQRTQQSFACGRRKAFLFQGVKKPMGKGQTSEWTMLALREDLRGVSFLTWNTHYTRYCIGAKTAGLPVEAVPGSSSDMTIREMHTFTGYIVPGTRYAYCLFLLLLVLLLVLLFIIKVTIIMILL